MTFPTTSILVDFTAQPDGGPPPTADFGNGLFGFGDMVVDTGLCIPDPANADPTLGDAPYIANTFTLPCEVWAILGPINANDYAAVYLFGSNIIYVFQWATGDGDTVFALLASDGGGTGAVWASEINEFAPLVEGGGLGMRVLASGTIELYATYNGTTWTLIQTLPSLPLPIDPLSIGLGSFYAGG